MKVRLSWTDAMRRLTRHITDYIEDTDTINHGDLYWLETLMNFRRPAVSSREIVDRNVNNDKVAAMFDRSGLAGVLLGEEHFPALEKRKIYSIHLVDQHSFGVRTRTDLYPNELVMGVPSYPANWRH